MSWLRSVATSGRWIDPGVRQSLGQSGQGMGDSASKLVLSSPLHAREMFETEANRQGGGLVEVAAGDDRWQSPPGPSVDAVAPGPSRWPRRKTG